MPKSLVGTKTIIEAITKDATPKPRAPRRKKGGCDLCGIITPNLVRNYRGTGVVFCEACEDVFLSSHDPLASRAKLDEFYADLQEIVRGR